MVTKIILTAFLRSNVAETDEEPFRCEEGGDVVIADEDTEDIGKVVREGPGQAVGGRP